MTPVLLQLDGQSRLLHHGTVSSNSFYKIEGFIPGQQYLLQTNSNGRRLDLSVSTPGSNSVDCNGSFHSDCVFTASDYELNLTVTDSQDGIGRPFVLSVVPADRPTTVYPEPVFEDMDLNYAALPHTGTVGSYFSNYRVTGLMPNQHYLVTISQNSEPMSLSVWPGSATTIQCRFDFQHPFGESCSSNADSNGVINIRVGGDDAGGQFTFDLVEAQLRSEHRSSDTPMVVPENSVPGAVSTITINDNEPADIVEVELQIEHGYTEDLEIILEAPDGQRVVLADHVPGTSFRNTIYSDLADLPNISEYGSRTHVLKTYRPNGFLHLLQGMSISGNWRLYVTDDRSTNISDALGGILHGWGLSFKSLAP